jgi:uncharacterized DUF497 family protein
MRFEWDEAKRQNNITKHGIDFVRAQTVFDRFHVIKPLDYEHEPRWRVTGTLDNLGVTVIYTVRKKNIRLISARKARKNEKREYQKLHEEAARRDDRAR